MMPNKNECLQHIQNTVDMLYSFEEFENIAFVKGLSLGIQGKKRESRMSGTIDENIRKYLQSEAFDMFETEIYPKEAHSAFPAVNSIEMFLTEYRKGLWEMYWKLSESANTFIVPLCLDDLACPLKKRASCIRKAIVELNRQIKRWNDCKQLGTPIHDLFIYETSDYNIHDSMEKKEESMGYRY